MFVRARGTSTRVDGGGGSIVLEEGILVVANFFDWTRRGYIIVVIIDGVSIR